MLLSVLHPAPVSTATRWCEVRKSTSAASWASVAGGVAGAAGAKERMGLAVEAGDDCWAGTRLPSRVMRSCGAREGSMGARCWGIVLTR